MSKALHPWNRRSDESAKAYDCFQLYLEAGASRSVVGVASRCGKSVSLLWRWSARHAWLDRARQWDTFQAAEKAKQLLAKEVDSRLRRSRHGELVEATGVRSIQMIAAEVAAGTRQLTVSEAAQLASVGARMDREAVQSAPNVQVTVGVGVNILPPDQIDPEIDDELAIRVATCFVDRWLKKYPGRSLPAMYSGETLTREQREADINRALRETGMGRT